MSTHPTDKYLQLPSKQLVTLQTWQIQLKKKNQSNIQKSSNTDKDVHPLDRQISSITKQVISHIIWLKKQSV